MEGEAGGEFPDWEVLHGAEAPPLVKPSESFEVIGGDSDSEGIIWSDYFSLDNQGRYVKTAGCCDASKDGSVGSDNPSWIDPGFDDRHGGRASAEFRSDSGSNRSEERILSDVDPRTGLEAAEIIKSQASFEEMTVESENLFRFASGDGKYRDLDGKGELDLPEAVKIQMDIEELDELRTLDKNLGTFWTDSCSAKLGDLRKNPEIRLDDLEKRGASEKGDVSSKEEEEEEGDDDGEPVVDEEKKKKLEWWKVPLQVIKFCVFRASPVWSLSVAAALMGFLILGRRLYKLKQKTQSFHLNVTVDDKKVSQYMIRAARLNEAFMVARRVPMARPSLPAAGAGVTVNMWPAMSVMR